MQNIIPLNQYSKRSKSVEAARFNRDIVSQIERVAKKLMLLEKQMILAIEQRPKLISFASQDGISIVLVNEIIRCSADGNYTCVYIKNQDPILVSKTLKVVFQLIGDADFIRVHSGHLVNKTMIRRISKICGPSASLENGDIIPISRSRWKSVLASFTN